MNECRSALCFHSTPAFGTKVRHVVQSNLPTINPDSRRTGSRKQRAASVSGASLREAVLPPAFTTIFPGFLTVAEIYSGGPGFSVSKLVRELVEAESVPFLPFQRYKDTGLRKRQDWEHVWDLQRKEDAIEAEVRSQKSGANEAEIQAAIKKQVKEKVGDIPVPPKYGSGDFKKSHWWKLRGKLDVPKERWIIYPGAERDGDPSPVIAWAGWDHLQQAKALASYYVDASTNLGWTPEKLQPLLAGLADLLPWLKHWHNEFDPEVTSGLGDYFAGFLDEEARKQGATVEALNQTRLGLGPEN
jgi:hypothetical protein